MSRQLGPIHYLMFEKIHYQEAITQKLLRAFEAGLQEDIQQKLPEIAVGDLAEIIDPDNVHGWLQNQVFLAEKRYAWTVSYLLKRGVSESEIIGIIRESAITKRPARILDAVDALDQLSRILLDGMPCDEVVHICEASSQRLSYRIEHDVHAPYWLELGEDPWLYYRLRTAWIQTWLEGSDYEFLAGQDGRGEAIFLIQQKDEARQEVNQAAEAERIARAHELYQRQCDHDED